MDISNQAAAFEKKLVKAKSLVELKKVWESISKAKGKLTAYELESLRGTYSMTADYYTNEALKGKADTSVLPEVEIVKLIRIEGETPKGEDPNTWGLIGAEVKITKKGKSEVKRYSLKQILGLKDKAKLKGFTIVNPGTPKAFLRRTRGQLIDLPTEFVKPPKKEELKCGTCGKSITQKELDANEGYPRCKDCLKKEREHIEKTIGEEPIEDTPPVGKPDPKLDPKPTPKPNLTPKTEEPKVAEVKQKEDSKSVEKTEPKVKAEKPEKEVKFTFEDALKVAKKNKLTLIGSCGEGEKEVQFIIAPQVVANESEGRYYLNCFLPSTIWHSGQQVPVMSQFKVFVASFGGRVTQDFVRRLFIIKPAGEIPKELGIKYENLNELSATNLTWYQKLVELGFIKNEVSMYSLDDFYGSPIKIGKENRSATDKVDPKEQKRLFNELDTYRVLSKYLSDLRTYFRASGIINTPGGEDGCHEIYKGLDNEVLEALAEAGVDIATRIHVSAPVREYGKGTSTARVQTTQGKNPDILAWAHRSCADMDEFTAGLFLKTLESKGVSKETCTFAGKTIKFLCGLSVQVREAQLKGEDTALNQQTTGVLQKLSQTISERLQEYQQSTFQAPLE